MGHGPEFAMDYPALPDDVWIIWGGNEHVWPDARRELLYLAADKRSIMKGFALYTSDANQAARFASGEEARIWLAQEEAKRFNPYHNIQVTTVAELKKRRFATIKDA